jgi:prolyl oligopeptidase
VKDQNAISDSHLQAIPDRANLHAAMTQAYDYTKYTAAEAVGDRICFFMNDGLKNQAIFYSCPASCVGDGALDVQALRDSGELKVVMDPNTLREDGTAALQGYEFR